ncbi:recombinase family protein [Wolbachia endosymbiont of Cimex lectularius]|uniref:recombinase family protein n=1 Tax=Wolbachia endosymbiont of Cimex lectularius TaxID=246273 RepID=UPI00049AFDD0|nr:recombinase family protein [Wolbachia endosymbiont of Cimex lectularius]BAO99504.1 putative site-specific recombinase [Wolbachia endosymbiont of Cimex lectularius]
MREETRFEINEEKAEIVRKLFAWVGQERVTFREAVQRLKKMRIITPKGKRDWHPSAINRILKNPAYKGQAAFGKTKVGPIKKEVAWEMREKSYSVYHNDRENWIHITIPSIIEEELFDAVQEQLAENRKRARVQKGKETSLLQGLAVCWHCGYTYHGIKSGNIKRSYYRCSGSNLYYCGETRICSSKPIRAEILETPVWEEVKSLLKEPDRIIKEYQHRISEHKKPLDKTFEKQKGRLNRDIEMLIDGYIPKHNLEEEESGLNQSIEGLTYCYNKGYIDEEGFKLRMKEIKQDLEKVKKQKEKMKDQEAVQRELASIANSLKRFSSSIKPELDQLHWIDRRSVIKKLVKRIEVSLDRITIVFRIKKLVQSCPKWIKSKFIILSREFRCQYCAHRFRICCWLLVFYLKNLILRHISNKKTCPTLPKMDKVKVYNIVTGV